MKLRSLGIEKKHEAGLDSRFGFGVAMYPLDIQTTGSQVSGDHDTGLELLELVVLRMNDELYQWYADQHVSPADTWAAWHTGCSEIGYVGQGCHGSCPVCAGSHYETEDDRIPLTYWRE